MNDKTLTARQQYYLDILNAVEQRGQTVAEAARERGIPASAVYSARRVLAAKGALPRAAPHVGACHWGQVL